jgi:hypothetical protein
VNPLYADLNRTNRKPFLRSATVAVAVLAVVIAAGPATAAEEKSATAPAPDAQSTDNLDPATRAIMLRQDALQPAVTAIYEAHMAEPDAGFTSVAFEGDGLSLYHKGTPTARMSAALDTARGVGPVTVKPAPYSLAELETAAAAVDVANARAGGNLQSVSLRYDGSGLDVERMPAVKSRRVARAAGKAALADIATVLRTASVSVPVSIKTATEEIEPLASRVADTPPWNGGGRWESWRGGDHRQTCTTGFGINAYSRTWVLTAAHCATAPDVAYQGVFGGGSGTTFTQMGGVAHESWQYDLILINAAGFYRMFDGGPTTSNYKNVTGWGYHAANELVCQSGASSGVVCSLRTGSSTNIVVSCSTPDSDGDCGYTISGLIRTTQTSGSTAARGGDSGGPVFTLMGTAGVRAKGIVSAGSGSTMYFQDWADVIRLYNGYPRIP